MDHLRITPAVLLLSALVAGPIEAQTADSAPSHALVARTVAATASLLPPVVQPVLSAQSRGGWRPLNIAKWSTAAAATGLAVYGVISNRRADEQFEELEQLCVLEPFRCSERLPDGSYQDLEMEARYQDVRALDRRARTALIAGQVGVGASVVLFLLDLRNSDGPENIPYEPRTFDVMRTRDGGVSMQLNVPLPSRH